MTSADVGWRAEARCAQPDLDPDMWDTADRRYLPSEAAHICRHHCPVRVRCLADAQARDRRQRKAMVLGGVIFNNTGRPSPAQTATSICRVCPDADPAAVVDQQARRREQWRRSSARHRAQTAVSATDVSQAHDEVAA
jgi:hypothetical protein